MLPPLGRLEYLYVGSSDVARDVAWWRDAVGAEVVWDHEGFGTRVAAVRVGDRPPLVLVAGHREAPGCLPVFAVEDLDAAARDLRARGWRPEGPPFEIPDGPCLLFRDPSGNEFAVFGNARPRALERPE